MSRHRYNNTALPRLLILEGPDGGGKTTLARHLVEEHGYVHIAHGPEPGKSASALFAQYLKAIGRAANARVVIDRAWLSERVYGKVHRKHVRLDPYHERMLARAALAFGGVHVFCMPPLEHCLRVFNSRRDQEMLQSNDALSMVHASYERLFYKELYDLPHVIYDITGGDTFRHVLTRINATQVSTLFNDCRPLEAAHVTGAWRVGSTCLVVGDGPHRQDHPRLPFTSPNRSSTGAWVTDQFMQAGVSEMRLTWVNATDITGRWQSTEFVKLLQPVKAIAMGNVAAQWCLRAGFTYFECVTNPVYWKNHMGDVQWPLHTAFRGRR